MGRPASSPRVAALTGETLGGLMMDYDLANYLLASLPADERAQTVASLRRANAAEFRRMRTMVTGRALHPAAGRATPATPL
jgi:hypothetical protein